MAPQPLREVDQRLIIPFKEVLILSRFHPLLTPNRTPSIISGFTPACWRQVFQKRKLRDYSYNKILCGAVYGVWCIPKDIFSKWKRSHRRNCWLAGDLQSGFSNQPTRYETRLAQCWAKRREGKLMEKGWMEHKEMVVPMRWVIKAKEKKCVLLREELGGGAGKPCRWLDLQTAVQYVSVLVLYSFLLYS